VTVKIFTAPGCQRCTLTARQFEKDGVPVQLIDVSEDEELRDHAISLVGGQRELPIVDAGKVREPWSGFKPEVIKEVIAAMKGA
jgi:glutaredoxin-like protein NrdH